MKTLSCRIMIQMKIVYDIFSDVGNFILHENVSLKQKELFFVKCIICSNQVRTCIIREKNKKHKFHCKSCAIKNEWSTEKYKKKHIEALKIAHNKPDVKKKHGLASSENWKNPDIRKKMGLLSLKETDEERYKKIYAKIAQKNSENYKNEIFRTEKLNNLAKRFSDKRWKRKYDRSYSTCYIEHNNKKIYLRSSYELRFAKLLMKTDIKWEYGKKFFKIHKINSLYIPDFFLNDFDAFIEIKGYFSKSCKEKYKIFLEENPTVKWVILFDKDIKQLESAENVKDCIEKICRQTSCL